MTATPRLVGAVGAGLVVLLAVVGQRALAGDSSPDLVLRTGNAAALHEGAPVYVNGQAAGSITSIDLDSGDAIVEIDLDDGFTPLHRDAAAVIRWKSVLGQRTVEIDPGTDGSGDLSSGAEVEVAVEQVDVDDVLAALDPKTRKNIKGLLTGLEDTLAPAEADLNATLKVSGPALTALGEIIEQVSQDGRALNQVITQLDALVTPLANRDDALTATITDLTGVADAVAEHQEALSTGLAELPATLQSADETLRAVEPAVAEARPLLQDLRPVSARLKSVSRQLAPVLVDLRPAISDLRPVLGELDELLGVTPDLLTNAHDVVPGLDSTVKALVPAVEFLRPYTPDLVGWLSNWASAFAYYDAGGHYASAVVRYGPQAFDENPGAPLSVSFDPAPPPGMAGRAPWTDANGSTMQ
jgi:phospholipid/cholesterol/gamma-HCH transport system substrate-binding protein